jgi:hypothetical protein
LEHIKFTDTVGVSEVYYPTPASFSIPKWYKNMESYLELKKIPNLGKNTATIKRCMPVFDVITSGYIIYSYVDVYVSSKDNQPFYEWPSYDPIQFHPIWQAPDLPNNTGHTVAYPKWINPWSITTPKGYSTLVVPPFHRESIFTILPGVVDTDKYISPINFPFVLNDVNFTGFIPAGTPIAQVIPFKRTSWKMDISSFDPNNTDVLKVHNLLRSKMFDSYKTIFRQVKEYK